ncbi:MULTISPECIES: hypothetical protein [Cupriavidus]
MKRSVLAVPLGCLVLSACTTQLTHEQLAGPGAQPAEPGFSYYLPRQRYSIAATYELQACQPKVDVAQRVTIVESSVADPKQHYSLPLQSLSSGWKTTTLTATVYDNQTLHTVGAQAEDRSAAVAKAAVGTVLGAVRIATGVAPLATAPQPCNAGILDALKTVQGSTAQLIDPGLDDKSRASLAAAVTAARAVLTFTKTYTFDPDWGESNLQQAYPPAAGDLQGWFRKEQLDTVRQLPALTTVIRLRAAPPKPAEPAPEWNGKGIVYREPAPIAVEVATGRNSDAPEQVLATLETRAGQFGRRLVLPLKNGPFQKNNLSLSFAANGQLESFTYGQESTLEKIASSVSDTAASAEGYIAKKRAADTAAATAAAGAELDALKAQTALLNAKSDKIEAEQRLTGLGGK